MDFSDKINLTRNAARFCIKGELRKEFDIIRKQLISGSQIRNALAHFQLVRSHELRFGESEFQSEYRLVPNILDPNEEFKSRSANEKPRSLNAEQIKNAANSFAALSLAIDSFVKKFQQHAASPK